MCVYIYIYVCIYILPFCFEPILGAASHKDHCSAATYLLFGKSFKEEEDMSRTADEAGILKKDMFMRTRHGWTYRCCPTSKHY